MSTTNIKFLRTNIKHTKNDLSGAMDPQETAD